jgi:hypothetical protein
MSELIDVLTDPERWRLFVTRGGPTCAGWLEADGTWVHEIQHEDGRVERFRSQTFPGELVEDHP